MQPIAIAIIGLAVLFVVGIVGVGIARDFIGNLDQILEAISLIGGLVTFGFLIGYAGGVSYVEYNIAFLVVLAITVGSFALKEYVTKRR